MFFSWTNFLEFRKDAFEAFSDSIYELLQTTHERVKLLVKELRKSGTYSSQEKSFDNKQSKEIDYIFKKSPLFEEIDVHQFDSNVSLFNDGLCPICKKQLAKIPAQKGKCSWCRSVILIKNSVFTGQKLILTESEFEQMNRIRDERVYRNWVSAMISGDSQLYFVKWSCCTPVSDLAPERGQDSRILWMLAGKSNPRMTRTRVRLSDAS